MKKPLLFSSFLLSMFGMLFFINISGQAQQTGLTKNNLSIKEARKVLNRSVLSTDPVYRLGREFKELEAKQERISGELKKTIARTREADRLYKKTIEYISPNDRMRFFLTEVQRLSAHGLEKKNIHQTIQKRLSVKTTTTGGSISGIITIDGSLFSGVVSIFAFDPHGFLAGEGESSFSDGSYTIEDLPAGDYYLVTQSSFVDEFYGGVLQSDFKNWRIAKDFTVSVSDNQTVTNIDFDLTAGAVVTGIITDQTNTVPIAFQVGSLAVFSNTNPGDVLRSEAIFTNHLGEYSFTIGDGGTYKIYVVFTGYKGEF